MPRAAELVFLPVTQSEEPFMHRSASHLRAIILATLLFSALMCRRALAADSPGLVLSELIFDKDAPTKSCHASTLAQTKEGLAAAWFGGTAEGDKDVGVWLSLSANGKWSAPVEVATGAQPDGSRLPCWNPVLFQLPAGPVMLFYKVGPNPREWWGLVMESEDGGKTWSPPRRLPAGILGPIKNKPVLLASGTLLCPSSTEDAGWRVHMERTSDGGTTWSKTDPLNDPKTFSLIQPTILDHGPAGIQVLCRSKQESIVESWSHDDGKSWGKFAATTLPNPNSGIDAVVLKDGRSLLVYNNTPTGRSPLNIAVSDDGKIWKAGPTLETEPGEYSYPAVIQTSDGLVHISYTWKRQRIKHVVVDPAKLKLNDP
jgi:predicted neuraminidase